VGLPEPKSIPYDLWMANQTTIKLVGLIHNMRILIHVIPYVIIFRIVHNNVT
jgi:hypothetical protein